MSKIKMKSDRPLYVGGEVTTEFETDEHHAKELEALGFASRVGGVKTAAAPAIDKPVAVHSATTTETVKKDSPENRDNFEREPVRGGKTVKK